jgi:pyruvate carboxylase
VTIGIQPGDKVTRGQKLATMEAMKMETTIYAEIDGRVAELLVKPGVQVETGELLIRLDRPL